MARKFDEFAEMMLNKCTMLRNKGKHEESLACMVDLTKKMPNLSLAWYHRGISLFNLGRYDESILAFDKAISLNDLDWVSLSARGMSKLIIRDMDSAKNDFSASLAIYPKDTHTLVLAAIHRILNGDSVLAQDYLDRSFKIDEDATVELYGLFIDSLIEKGGLSPSENSKLKKVKRSMDSALEKLGSVRRELKDLKKKK